jgi:hypothetical protein
MSGTGSLPNSKRPDDEPTESLVLKVVQFMDRVVDLPPNACALAPQQWMEWIWDAFGSIISEREVSGSVQPARPRIYGVSFSQNLEKIIRSIVRKICVADLSRQTRNSSLRRLKDLVDVPDLQQLVLQEIVRHFSANNRLDQMSPDESTNVIKNLDALLQGLEDSLSPFPVSLGLEIVKAISAIAVNNNTWVRLRMKNNSKLFETRDRLAFMLLAQARNLAAEDSAVAQGLVDANLHDANAAVVVQRQIVDHIREKRIEEVEVLQRMLRQLYTDEEQKKALHRMHDDATLIGLLRDNELGAVDSTTPNLISWCLEHDALWDAATQKIFKAYKVVEGDIKSSAERREKERLNRFKSRKLESEKRLVACQRAEAEFDRLRAEVEARAQAYHDIVAELRID